MDRLQTNGDAGHPGGNQSGRFLVSVHDVGLQLTHELLQPYYLTGLMTG